jgi:hypothetical protein
MLGNSSVHNGCSKIMATEKQCFLHGLSDATIRNDVLCTLHAEALQMSSAIGQRTIVKRWPLKWDKVSWSRMSPLEKVVVVLELAENCCG